MRFVWDHSKSRDEREQGFTLLVVIWALSILIVLSLVFGATVSAHLKTTRNAIDNARAEAFADAGIELAVLDLSGWRAQTEHDPRFPRNGRSVRCSLGAGDWLNIAIQDEVGKVDINMADERLIGAALVATGVVADEAPGMAQRILDYRDGDNDRRQNGAEREEYRDRGRAGPKNQPFDTIEEVEQVLGIPAGLADALGPFVTVYSGQMHIDSNFAHKQLLAALSNPRSDLARAEGPSMLEEMSQASQPVNMVTGAGGRAFRVLAQAHTAQGAVFVREAVIEFVATGPGAYAFRRWRKASEVLPDSQPVERSLLVTEVPPC